MLLAIWTREDVKWWKSFFFSFGFTMRHKYHRENVNTWINTWAYQYVTKYIFETIAVSVSHYRNVDPSSMELIQAGVWGKASQLPLEGAVYTHFTTIMRSSEIITGLKLINFMLHIIPVIDLNIRYCIFYIYLSTISFDWSKYRPTIQFLTRTVIIA